MSTTTYTTLHSDYYHVHNGGMTLEILQDDAGVIWFSHSYSHFGVPGPRGMFPLAHPDMLSWIGNKMLELKLQDLVKLNGTIDYRSEADLKQDDRG